MRSAQKPARLVARRSAGPEKTPESAWRPCEPLDAITLSDVPPFGPLRRREALRKDEERQDSRAAEQLAFRDLRSFRAPVCTPALQQCP